jgi:hypothetical protein
MMSPVFVKLLEKYGRKGVAMIVALIVVFQFYAYYKLSG